MIQQSFPGCPRLPFDYFKQRKQPVARIITHCRRREDFSANDLALNTAGIAVELAGIQIPASDKSNAKPALGPTIFTESKLEVT